MSIQSLLLRTVLRLTIKRQFKQTEIDYQALRNNGASRFLPDIPSDIAVVPVKVGEVRCEWIIDAEADPNRVVLYLHGGGYVLGGLDSYRDICWRLSQLSGMRVLLIDYRLAPEHPFPAAVEDATACYGWLLAEGYEPESLGIAGDSAGGGLALATMMRLKELKLALPACAALMSPWVDLTNGGDSMASNRDADPMLSKETLEFMAHLYVDDENRRNPHASPLFGDLSEFPPVLIQIGSTEILLSDAIRLADRIRAAGGDVVIDIWPRMPHVWQLFSQWIPESRKALHKLAQFLQLRIPYDRRIRHLA